MAMIFSGRFENGQILSELVYSASNLLVFINDNVFKAAAKAVPKLVGHYVNVSVLIKFSQKISVLTLIIVSSP